MRLKFEGLQRVWIAKNGHPVIIVGRTEFFNDRQPRYCVQSETFIPGKNMNQDWINEDQLTAIEPVVEASLTPPKASGKIKAGKLPGVRKKGLAGKTRAGN